MIIVRDGVNIELTSQEVFSAYEEQEHIFDVQDVSDELHSIVSADVDEEEYVAAAKRILESQELLNSCAYDHRRNIDKYDMDWYSSKELAVKDAVCKEMQT